MKIYDADFADSLITAQDGSIRPAWFVWVEGRDRDTGAVAPVGLWSGDEDITLTLARPDGVSVSRTYVGGCNLSIADGIPYVAELTDNPVRVSISQIADAAQLLVRGYDIRMGYCEIHATTWSGGRLTSAPQLQWVGIVDEAPIGTPAVGGSGSINITVRSEIMHQLTAINPAKSSDAHQKRRLSRDRFCAYAGTIEARKVEWFKN